MRTTAGENQANANEATPRTRFKAGGFPTSREPGAGRKTGHDLRESRQHDRRQTGEQGLEDSCHGVGRREEEKGGREGRDRGDRYGNQGELEQRKTDGNRVERKTGNGKTIS